MILNVLTKRRIYHRKPHVPPWEKPYFPSVHAALAFFVAGRSFTKHTQFALLDLCTSRAPDQAAIWPTRILVRFKWGFSKAPLALLAMRAEQEKTQGAHRLAHTRATKRDKFLEATSLLLDPMIFHFFLFIIIIRGKLSTSYLCFEIGGHAEIKAQRVTEEFLGWKLALIQAETLAP